MGKSAKENREEVYRLFKRHKQVPVSVERWAKDNAFDKGRAYRAYKEGRYWCSDCGGSFEVQSEEEHDFICPHCGKTLEVPKTYKGDWGRGITRKCDYAYVQRLTVIKGWQVIQQLSTVKTSVRGKEAQYHTVLLFEHWLNPDKGQAHLIGRYLKMCCSWCEMPFALGSDFSFHRLGYWYEDWKSKVYPKQTILPFLARFNPDEIRLFYGINTSTEEIYHSVSTSPVIAETIYKIGDNSLGELFFGLSVYRSRIIRFWKSILVTRRHGYLQKMSGTLALRDWLDYIEELRYLGKDVRNPHFICPADLQEAHSSTSVAAQKKKLRAEERAENTRRIRNERAQLELLEKDKKAKDGFEKKIKPYAALVITDKNLRITPLLSIQDFMEEGAAMEHCVFSNKYYARDNCLILSARSADSTKRIETIEIDTANWRIVQSRAYKNGQSKFHDEIISLLTDNMDTIKSCKHKSKQLRNGNSRN